MAILAWSFRRRAMKKIDNGAAQILSKYMHDVGQYPVLEPEVQLALCTEFHSTRNERLSKKLVNHNLRLVIKIAFEYRSAHNNMMDLIQEGNIGLIKAVDHYDPSEKTTLSYYASYWIRAYILRFILNNFGPAKVATTDAKRKIFFNLRKQEAKLEAQGIVASDDLLAKEMGVKEEEISEMNQRMNPSTEIFDVDMEDLEAEFTPADMVLENAERDFKVSSKLQSFFQTLNGPKAQVFQMRYLTDEPETFEDIGNKIGRTKQRAQQIDAMLRQDLREYLKEFESAVVAS